MRAATGAPAIECSVAESMIPRPSSAQPAPELAGAATSRRLWDAPIVGDSGTTVGEALTEMMHPDGYFIRQLDRLGQSLVEARGLLAVPLLGGWLARNGAQAYHRGFVERLAAQPRQAILAVAGAGSGERHDRGAAAAAAPPVAAQRARGAS